MPKKFSKPHLSRIINGDITTPEALTKTPKTRLDIALQSKYPEYNRSTLQKYIRAGQVQVNGTVETKPNAPVTDTDELKLYIKDSSGNLNLFSISREDADISKGCIVSQDKNPTIPIIYEDQNVIVLNKPAGILTISKGAFNPEPTLESYGLIAHRLDRDTSGVIILAKNQETLGLLQKQFQNRKAHKTYYAITEGHPKLPEAIISVPLARNLRSPTTFQPDPSGREAITHYTDLGIGPKNGKYGLIMLKPQTGRTHQLRIHLAHIGTPILGDKIYGKPHKTPAARMFLHAAELEISIPDPSGAHSNIRKTFKAPLPQEFQDVLR